LTSITHWNWAVKLSTSRVVGKCCHVEWSMFCLFIKWESLQGLLSCAELDVQCCRHIDSSKFVELSKLTKLQSLNLYRTVIDLYSMLAIIRFSIWWVLPVDYLKLVSACFVMSNFLMHSSFVVLVFFTSNIVAKFQCSHSLQKH